MGTLQEKLSYLSETKEAIKQAIIAKNVVVEDADTFRSYAEKIESIKSGGDGSVVVSSVVKAALASEILSPADVVASPVSPNIISEVVVSGAKMTSRTFSSAEEADGYVFSNSIWGNDRAPYMAFDGNASTFWSTESTDDQNGCFIGYNFHKLIENVTIQLTTSTDNVPDVKFKFQGCKDSEITEDSVWEDVTDEIGLDQYQSKTTLEYNIKSATPYCAYRLYIISGRQGSTTYGWAVYEMSIKGDKTLEVSTSVFTQSLQTVLDKVESGTCFSTVRILKGE